MGDAPRVLITGFGPFPGAPVNPTAALVERLRAEPLAVDLAHFRAEVLDVDYATIEVQLAGIARDARPDVAIHFGLAQACRGFRLERLARNSHARARPDAAGSLPAAAKVCTGPDVLPSTLPLERIATALATAGLPVEWSDDAGGYLCNTVMTLSLAHACDGLAPRMSGFVHVPLPREASGLGGLSLDEMVAGAGLIVGACLEAWQASHP